MFLRDDYTGSMVLGQKVKYFTGRQEPTTPEHRMLSSEDAGHRDWRNVRNKNLWNTAKQPEKPTTTIGSQP